MKGFTFIELLLVIAILAVIGGLSVPFYSRFLSQNAVSDTTDHLVQSLRKAQFYAMTSRKSNSLDWGVNIDNTAKTITLYQGNAFTGHDAALDEVYNINPNITISPISVDLNFNRLSGIPNSSNTFTITGNNQSQTVSVNTQGVVTR